MSRKLGLDVSAFAASKSFYKALEKEDGNVVFSPVSCIYALGMLYAGSKNRTRSIMAKVLQLPEDLNETGTLFEVASAALLGVNGVELSIANRAFAAKDINIQLDYLNIISKSFMSSAGNVDFSRPEEATAQINAWVKAETKGLIEKLYDENLEAATRLVLLNTLYFKGVWQTRFDEKETKMTQYFWGYREILMEVPMMHQRSKLLYASLPEIESQVVVIPYQGGDINLVVILPNEKDGMYKITIDQQEDLKSLMSKTALTEIDLYLPKFKIESTIKLNSYLIEMGLSDIFDNPDLSGISQSEGLKVSHVVQKAVIEVNEEGTVASASTGIDTGRSSPKVFLCDHPFFYFLTYRDNFSLVGGKYDSPRASFCDKYLQAKKFATFNFWLGHCLALLACAEMISF